MVKTKKEIELMSVAGRAAAEIMCEIIGCIDKGINGIYINDLVKKQCLKHKVSPAFYGYNGYKYNVCISINNAIVHCEPSEYDFEDGDMLKFDMGVSYENYCADMARTIIVGHGSKDRYDIVVAAKEIFDEAMDIIVPGKKIGDISHTIHKATLKRGYDIVQDFSSHGIGQKIHEQPQILHYGLPGKGGWLFSGMTFAIEPIIRNKKGKIKALNEWCMISDPPCLSAHYEDTILITDDGPEVLTRC